MRKVILGVTGSIAAYKAGDIIRRLQDCSCDVTVIMTKEAEAFITPLTLASLSGKAVYHNFLDANAQAPTMSHISLAREADALLIAPATANIIGKLACGLADDLLTCTVVSTKAPIIIAPAMNDEMYQNKIVQENCKKLKSFGIHFIDPVKGKLACGTAGVGHLAEAGDIINAVEKILR